MNSRLIIIAAIALPLFASGCIQPQKGSDTAPMAESTPESAQEAPMKGGIPIPPAARENLGITFAKVERRAVAETRRVPGQFELLPTARQQYHAPFGGRIHLAVEEFQQVAERDILFTIDSPHWRQIQHEAVEAEGDITMAQAALEVAKAQRHEATAMLSRQQERLQNLGAVNVRNAELEASVAGLRSSLPRLEAEIQAQEAALREAHEHYASRLNTLASVTGIPPEELREEKDGIAAWRSISALHVVAQAAGTVEKIAISEGSWLEEGELAMSVVDPSRIRFHAEAPQTDIGLYHDGQQANIVPPQGATVEMQDTLRGTVTVGLTAHETDRTLSLYVNPEGNAEWARAGIGGYLEVTLTDNAATELAVPMAAVVQDGLEHVFYRRDPKDPDRALRVLADLGPSEGRWVVLRSGVKEGDEVVLDGVYALKLSSSGQQAPAGYHYHADGQLHKNH